MLAHINLLGRVCCNGVCSRQVGYVYTVILVVETAGLGVDGDTAVVAHMLVLLRECIENRCLAAVGVTNQCHVYHIVPVCDDFALRAVNAVKSVAVLAHRECTECGCRCKFLFCLVLGQNLNHGSLVASQQHIVAHYMVLYGVVHGGVEYRFHLLATYEPHLHYALTEPAVSGESHNNRCFAISEFREFHLYALFLLSVDI